MDAQSSIGGIPSRFVEEKKKELRLNRERDMKIIEQANRFNGGDVGSSLGSRDRDRNRASDFNDQEKAVGSGERRKKSRWDSGDANGNGNGAGSSIGQAVQAAANKASEMNQDRKSRDERQGDERGIERDVSNISRETDEGAFEDTTKERQAKVFFCFLFLYIPETSSFKASIKIQKSITT